MKRCTRRPFFMSIWYNSQIKVNRKSLFIEKWYKKGVKVVGDFLDMNGNLLSKETFEENFGIAGICFLQYEGICRAVKKIIRIFVKVLTFLFIFLAYLKTKKVPRIFMLSWILKSNCLLLWKNGICCLMMTHSSGIRRLLHVLKRQKILHYNGFNTACYIEFCQLVITLKW